MRIASSIGSEPADWGRRFRGWRCASSGCLDAAVRLDDLRVPPGNRLERLRGDRAGQYSIRINDQWRICFRWRDGDAYDVEIVVYH
jgi:hypothetical protein